MTHAELYKIVKDHRDVWGEHMFPQIHPLHGTIWWANRAMFGMPANTQLVEPALLGLGVEWLVGHLGALNLYAPAKPGGPHEAVARGLSEGSSLLAAVYAAIAEVKAKA